MMLSITRAGHIEFRVTNLERARAFYVDTLGFVETASEGECLYLGALEERELYSLVLRKADSPGVGHIAFRVAVKDDLEALEELYARHDCPTRWVAEGHQHHGRALRVQDASGLPIEFYHAMPTRERLLQRFDLYRGAHIMRLDHFNCQITDVQAGYQWFTRELGFSCSEYTVNDDEALWAVWLHRKQNVHDIALMNGTGPRLHHAGFWVQDTASVLKACDVLAAAGSTDSIERGPGRHGLSNAFFLYLRDPDGNRIELYTSDYMIPDPDWQPIRWNVNDPRRATFWGHKPPASWFDQASPVENILTGELVPTSAPPLRDRPEFVT